MKLKRTLITLSAISLLGGMALAADSEEGFVSLMDGKSFDGWKKAVESPETWTVQNGEFVAHGNRCHLFYVGDEKPFKNFHLKAEVMTKPGSNGGIYICTKYQERDWPRQGFESQVNCTQGDWIKTGSLYGIVNVGHAFSKDNQWWTQEIIVEGKTITVKVDGTTVLQYTEPEGAQPGRPFTRVISEGTFALQGHDPGSEIHYRNIRVKRLP
ncbi:MAG: DUF1080 domain-containing protein [Verrucomicrobiales bacterium]|nr:DUF1080 domain-containing protein [Verrucomicrobiales bacterium]